MIQADLVLHRVATRFCGLDGAMRMMRQELDDRDLVRCL